jgi:hypothetical protein
VRLIKPVLLPLLAIKLIKIPLLKQGMMEKWQ